MPYLKGDSPSLLEANVPAITQAYITTRCVSMRACMCVCVLKNTEQQFIACWPFLRCTANHVKPCSPTYSHVQA